MAPWVFALAGCPAQHKQPKNDLGRQNTKVAVADIRYATDTSTGKSQKVALIDLVNRGDSPVRFVRAYIYRLDAQGQSSGFKTVKRILRVPRNQPGLQPGEIFKAPFPDTFPSSGSNVPVGDISPTEDHIRVEIYEAWEFGKE